MVTRKNRRYRVEYGGSFLGEQRSAQGVFHDLSLDGGRAHSEKQFTKGEYLRVLIDVPRYDKPLHVTLAVVRWSSGNEFGMEFIQMEPSDQQRFRQLIREMAAALSTQEGFR